MAQSIYKCVRSLCWGVVLGLICATGASAADDNKKIVKSLQERVQRMQQAQQVAEQEKTQLQSEKMAMERQLQGSRIELDRLRSQSRRDAIEIKDAEGLRTEKEALRTQLADLSRQLTELKLKLNDASDADANTKVRIAAIQEENARQAKSLASCETQNKGLYQLNTELLERYTRVAGAGSWRTGGALTQIGKVRVENDAAACQDRLDDMKLTPQSKPQN